MSDEPKPALTPEEWARRAAQRPTQYGMNGFSASLDLDTGLTIENRGSDDSVSHDSAAHLAIIMALANAALPDDSLYKITRADVDLLRRLVSELRWAIACGELTNADPDEFEPFAAKLSALLPPEKPADEPEVERRERLDREVFSTPIGTRVVIEGKSGTVTGNLRNGTVVVEFDDPPKE